MTPTEEYLPKQIGDGCAVRYAGCIPLFALCACLGTPFEALESALMAPPTTTRVLGEENALINEKRLALVIGNSSYGHASLKNPVNDADSVATRLRELGFEVIPRIDLDRAQMFTEVKDFSNRLGSYGVGLLYYSGHGLQVDGENYLIPIDAQIEHEHDVTVSAVPLTAILTYLNVDPVMEGSTLRILILDACRDSLPFTRSFKSAQAGLTFVASSPPGFYIAFATQPGATASDNPSGPNGLYTSVLLEHMHQGRRIEDVFIDTRRDVMRRSKNTQRPWEEGSLVTYFVF